MKTTDVRLVFGQYILIWYFCACVPVTFKRDFYTPHSITVCRGQMRSIACPNLELIHIYNAFYGKLSGHDCSSPVHQFRDQIPTCFSKTAPGSVKEMCHGQQSCDLYAEDSLYDDPCPSVTKYLFVSFTCQGKSQLNAKLQNLEQQKTLEFVNQALPAVQNFIQQRNELKSLEPQQTVLVCTGQSRSIVCPSLQLLKIKSAFYGKEQNKDCSGKYTHDSTPSCYAHDTLNAVKDMCDGQQSCDLFAEPDLYGKSTCAPSTPKYLQVSYNCEGHSDLNSQIATRGGTYMPQIAPGYYGQSPINNQNGFFQNGRPNIAMRSSLPDYDHNQLYNEWKKWANANEISQWERSFNQFVNQPMESAPTLSMGTPLANLRSSYQNYDTFERLKQRAYIPQPELVQPAMPSPSIFPTFNMDTPLSNLRSAFPDYNALENAKQRALQRAVLRGDVAQPLTTMESSQVKQPSYDPMTYPIMSSNFVQNPSRPCEQCNGDCNNYVCYGCGGCPVPPPEKQLYAYSYQKQDAGYHDAFQGHVMDLSGMVLFPIPAAAKAQLKVSRSRIGKSDTPADDDDDDDDSNNNDDEDESDDDDVDDESDDKINMNKTKKSKTSKKKQVHG